MTLYTIIAVIAILVLASIALYNNLVTKRNRVQQAFSTIDVLLKNRHDLLPNLVATAQKYMEHEGETLTRITELRSDAVNARKAPDSRIAADVEIQRLLGGLRLQVENYPELKADLIFMQLFSSLEEMEGQLVSARRTYNAVVTDFNNSQEVFPANLIARQLGFRRGELLKTSEEERVAPSVKQLFAQ